MILSKNKKYFQKNLKTQIKKRPLIVTRPNIFVNLFENPSPDPSPVSFDELKSWESQFKIND